MRKRVVVTGAEGQDGQILTQRLQERGDEIYAISRHNASVDLFDPESIERWIVEVMPHEVYHLAACHYSSEKGLMFDSSHYEEMVRVNFTATFSLVQALCKHAPQCRLFYAASSQMYTPYQGIEAITPKTGAAPSTFYGYTKQWSRELIDYYRRHFSLYAVVGILFNHESRYRKPHFVTRKISQHVAQIRRGENVSLELQNSASRTDWSSAHDVVEGMILSLQQQEPRDYVFASGETHSIHELVEDAFLYIDKPWKEHVIYREERETPALYGNIEATCQQLNWKPTISIFEEMRSMIDYDTMKMGKK